MSNQLPSRQEFDANLIAKAQADAVFREELLRDPTGVFERELGLNLPPSVEVKVLEETASTLYLVLPRQLPQAENSTELSEDALEEIAGGFQLGGGGFQFGGGGFNFGGGFQFSGGGFQFGGGGFQFGGGFNFGGSSGQSSEKK